MSKKQTLNAEGRIVAQALEATTLDQAQEVQAMIADAIGGNYQRPLGDRSNNLGLLDSAGNRDHKLLELLTNAQDAVLERLAVARLGSLESVPYRTPHEATRDLLGPLSWREQADLVRVSFHESDPPVRRTKKLTVAVDDPGTGIAPDYLSRSLFHLGSSHKTKAAWQQGAFGIGGAKTFRHADAVVVVTRRHPDLLQPGEEDRVTVAVCGWETNEKGEALNYLVTQPWEEGCEVPPYSVPAAAHPEFEGGTHIALISYGIEHAGLAISYRERSFGRMTQTRLFDPVVPVSFDNKVAKNEPTRRFRGLKHQLASNPHPDRKEGNDAIAFPLAGRTYQLPVTWYAFPSATEEQGGKRNQVARGHSVIFVSGGQVHHHWSPEDVKAKTDLSQIHDRVLVVVELDEIPLVERNKLFHSDRSGFIYSEARTRIEDELVAFLDDREGELFRLNGEVLRDIMNSRRNGRPTIDVARRIGRALQFKGGFRFARGRRGRRKGGGTGGRRRPKPDLYADPTTLEGAERMRTAPGLTRVASFHVNAVDEFFASGRGRLRVGCTHPDVGRDEITVGELRSGRVRVTVTLPEDAELGNFELNAELHNWQRAAGGIGPDMDWCVRLEVVKELSAGTAGGQGDAKSDEGELVGIIWRGLDAKRDGWHQMVPGEVTEMPAETLSQEPGYERLQKLGNQMVPTIILNEDYRPLKDYVEARSHLGKYGIDLSKDRYSTGVGYGLLAADRDLRDPDGKKRLEGEADLALKHAIAGEALVMLTDYDKLAKASGVSD